MALSCVHTQLGTGLPWPCLCVCTHGPHAATLTSKRAVPLPEPRLCGAQEAMPTSVTTRRFMACHIIIRGGQTTQIHPCMCALIGACWGAHACVSRHADSTTRVTCSVCSHANALIPCILELQLFLMHALSSPSNPSSQRRRHPSSLDKVYGAHLFAPAQAITCRLHTPEQRCLLLTLPSHACGQVPLYLCAPSLLGWELGHCLAQPRTLSSALPRHICRSLPRLADLYIQRFMFP